MPTAKKPWLKAQQLDIDSEHGIYQSAIVPFFDKFPLEYFEGEAGVAIAYKRFKQPIARSKAIVLVNGRSESLLKYKELIYELYLRGLSVYTLDHRDQGLSGRSHNKSTDFGCIDDIDHYPADLNTFVTNIVPTDHSDYFLLGHSMGGAIAVRYITHYEHPFSKLALFAPMFEPRVLNRPFTYFSRYFTLPISSRFNGYVLTQKPFTLRDENKPCLLRHFSDRHRLIRRLYNETPAIQLGGATRNWLYQWLIQMRPMARLADNIAIPTMILQAEREVAVNNAAISEFGQRLERKGEGILVRINGARHELFHESDVFRNRALHNLWNFLN